VLSKFIILTSFFNLIISTDNFAQIQLSVFEGKYEGMMLIYKQQKNVDSLPVLLTINNILPDSVWQWKTEYLSTKMPVTKNYQLSVADRSKGMYLTDEGDGVILFNYLFGNKMYCQFETAGLLLTSTYEFINDNEIIFEVTAGKKITRKNTDEIVNYQVNTLQKTNFKRKKQLF